jgi:hypothetical protein
MPRPVQHAKAYTQPGVAFRIHPARQDRFAGAIGTVLNKINRIQSEKFMHLMRESRPGEAVDFAYTALSDAYPGFYFGCIGPDEEGWIEYGWLPDGVAQYEGESGETPVVEGGSQEFYAFEDLGRKLERMG